MLFLLRFALFAFFCLFGVCVNVCSYECEENLICAWGYACASVASLDYFILCILDMEEGVGEVAWMKTPSFEVVMVCFGLLCPSLPPIAVMLFIRGGHVNVG